MGGAYAMWAWPTRNRRGILQSGCGLSIVGGAYDNMGVAVCRVMLGDAISVKLYNIFIGKIRHLENKWRPSCNFAWPDWNLKKYPLRHICASFWCLYHHLKDSGEKVL